MITEEQAELMRLRRAAGATVREVADEFGCSTHTVGYHTNPNRKSQVRAYRTSDKFRATPSGRKSYADGVLKFIRGNFGN